MLRWNLHVELEKVNVGIDDTKKDRLQMKKDNLPIFIQYCNCIQSNPRRQLIAKSTSSTVSTFNT